MVQTVRQTWQERFDMYMKLTKKELATMLAESAKIVNPDGCTECENVNPCAGMTYYASSID